MKTLMIDVPEAADEQEIRMAGAAILYDKCVSSAGQAAASVGIIKRALLKALVNIPSL